MILGIANPYDAVRTRDRWQNAFALKGSELSALLLKYLWRQRWNVRSGAKLKRHFALRSDRLLRLQGQIGGGSIARPMAFPVRTPHHSAALRRYSRRRTPALPGMRYGEDVATRFGGGNPHRQPGTLARTRPPAVHHSSVKRTNRVFGGRRCFSIRTACLHCCLRIHSLHWRESEEAEMAMTTIG